MQEIHSFSFESQIAQEKWHPYFIFEYKLFFLFYHKKKIILSHFLDSLIKNSPSLHIDLHSLVSEMYKGSLQLKQLLAKGPEHS